MQFSPKKERTRYPSPREEFLANRPASFIYDFIGAYREEAAFWLLLLLIIMPLAGLYQHLTGIVGIYSSYMLIYILKLGVALWLVVVLLLLHGAVRVFVLRDGSDLGFRSFLKHHLPAVLFTALLLWAGLSVLFSENLSMAYFGSGYRQEGFYMYTIYAAVAVCAVQIVSDKRRRLLLHSFLFVSLPLCAVMLGQHFRYAYIVEHFGGLDTSVFFNSNHFAYYLTMTCLTAAGLWMTSEKLLQRLIFAALFAFEVWVLILNSTFGSYLAVLIASAAGFFLWGAGGRVRYADRPHAGRWIAALPLLLMLLISAVIQAFPVLAASHVTVISNFAVMQNDITRIVTDPENADRAGSGRFILWKLAVKYIGRHPVFGSGPDCLGFYYLADGQSHDRPHNEYLQIATSLGIPALIFYAGGLVTLLVRQWKHWIFALIILS